MIHHRVEQNTDEWLALRMGKYTASQFKDLFMATTTATYKKAIYSVVYERLTGEMPESFSSDYMQRGHDLEAQAVEAYEKETFTITDEPGFFELNDWVGASPDRIIAEDGLLEVKSPAYNTMIDYLIKKKLPSIYKWQVQGQLMVTGRSWCDFTCYHPKLPLLILRVKRDDKMIQELRDKLAESIKEAKKIMRLIG